MTSPNRTRPRPPKARPASADGLSLEWKLPLLISALVLVVVVLYSWAAYTEVRESAVRSATERVHRVAEELAAGAVVAQQRDVITGLKETIDDTISPAVSDWNRIKTLGWGFSALLVAMGITGASLWTWAGDTLGAIVKKWLKIE